MPLMPDIRDPKGPSELLVPMRNVVGFIRQLSHDLRNHLNAAELQSAYVNELADNPELKSEVQRLRGMLSKMAATLQGLTSSLAPIKLTPMSYEANSFIEDLEQKVAMLFSELSGAIDWEVNTGSAALQIDPQFLQQAFVELFANAFQHDRGPGRLRATAEVKDGEFLFTLREPKEVLAPSTENLDGEPFRKVSHGHYGLGLHRVRNIIEAHHGRIHVRHDQSPSALVTTVVLPLAEAD
jgi:K+-sensing histidine kinase KdpD